MQYSYGGKDELLEDDEELDVEDEVVELLEEDEVPVLEVVVEDVVLLLVLLVEVSCVDVDVLGSAVGPSSPPHPISR